MGDNSDLPEPEPAVHDVVSLLVEIKSLLGQVEGSAELLTGNLLALRQLDRIRAVLQESVFELLPDLQDARTLPGALDRGTEQSD